MMRIKCLERLYNKKVIDDLVFIDILISSGFNLTVNRCHFWKVQLLSEIKPESYAIIDLDDTIFVRDMEIWI